MERCTRCDAELGLGRFCTNCGQPVGEPYADSWRTDTAERPRVVVPPPASSVPGATRFPLFADEQPAPADPAPAEPPAPADDPDGTGESPRHRDDQERGGRAWLPWVLGFVALALVAGLGGWLLISSDDPGPALSASDPAPTTDRGEQSPDPEPTPTPEETTSAPPDASPVVASELARFASVTAPPAAPPGQDNSGNTVRYVPAHLVDGVPETTWRTPGDATGETLVFRFDTPVVLREVGLVNGYAKVGQDAKGVLDWYHGNRRVLAVEWVLDDGTTIDQQLGDTTVMQAVPVRKVRTQTVRLRLMTVSTPGPGRASRDFTAISEVRLFGVTR